VWSRTEPTHSDVTRYRAVGWQCAGIHIDARSATARDSHTGAVLEGAFLGFNLLRRLGLVVFSAGWVLPVWYAGMTAGGETIHLIKYLIFGGRDWPTFVDTGTSFPVEEFTYRVAGWLFTFGCLWLIAVIAFWVLRATRSQVAR
jgi:hypothetical protein